MKSPTTEIPSETAVKLLVSRAAKPKRPSEVYSGTRFVTHMNLNQEFAEGSARSLAWFFGALAVFILLYAVHEMAGVR